MITIESAQILLGLLNDIIILLFVAIPACIIWFVINCRRLNRSLSKDIVNTCYDVRLMLREDLGDGTNS
jgi:hypothetical protein